MLAVERDDDFVSRLRRRFADLPQVRVVHADLRSVPLPHRTYAVVSSIPYSVTSPLLARLLDSPRTSLGGADLVVEWGLAKRLTEASPRDLSTAWWAARFDLTLRRRIAASCFNPAPSVDSAHLVIRRSTGLRAPVQRVLWAVLSAAYGGRNQPARTAFDALLPRRRAQRMLTANGVDPTQPAAPCRYAGGGTSPSPCPPTTRHRGPRSPAASTADRRSSTSDLRSGSAKAAQAAMMRRFRSTSRSE